MLSLEPILSRTEGNHALRAAGKCKRVIPLLLRLALAIAALVLAACGAVTPTPALTIARAQPLPGQVLIEVGGGSFVADVADTPEARRQGLSARPSLRDDHSMWFDLGEERVATFVMREMRFPLDIVWVDAVFRVRHVSADAPAPTLGTVDEALVRYSPPVPVRYVLEINAGLAAAHGISDGDLVRLSGGR